MAGKRRFFTSEGYKRLERNPFVDKKMLQFIREKWREAASETPPAAKNTPSTAATQRPGTKKQPTRNVPGSQKTQIDDKVLKLMTARIRDMLRE